MRVGKQNGDLLPSWISGQVAARGSQGAAQRDWGLLQLRVVSQLDTALHRNKTNQAEKF